MIYLYYLLLSGFLLLSQSGQQSPVNKIIRTQEFLSALSSFTESVPDSGKEEGLDTGAKVIEERKKEIASDTTIKPETESTTIYFYKKISSELQL